MRRPWTVLLTLLVVASALVACSPKTSSSYRVEGCSVENVFTCVIERGSDGRTFSVWLRNTADVSVTDVSVVVTNVTCIVEQDEAIIERLDAEQATETSFTCTGVIPSTLRGNLDILYTLVSGYAGEPPRPTSGEFVSHKQ